MRFTFHLEASLTGDVQYLWQSAKLSRTGIIVLFADGRQHIEMYDNSTRIKRLGYCKLEQIVPL